MADQELQTSLPATRFWSKVKKSEHCWEWAGCRNRDGYGRFSVGLDEIRAHRFSWELANGNIPEGLCVLHRCDNPPCVNPDHLFLGTVQDNAIDAISKGRARIPVLFGKSNPAARLTAAKVRKMRSLRNSRTMRSLAAEFGVCPATVYKIVSQKTWRSL